MGRAEIRVRPTQVRVVLALISRGRDAADCEEANRATREALAEAQRRAGLLLTPLSPKFPRPFNLAEETRVVHPDSLYEGFPNLHEQDLQDPWQNRLPRIRLARPKNTFYRGSFVQGDRVGRGLPLRPEIPVISTVQPYFKPPGVEGKEREGVRGRRRVGRPPRGGGVPPPGGGRRPASPPPRA